MDRETIYLIIDSVKWPVGILVAALAYFLRDAHVSIKNNIDKKADREALDSAFAVYRNDMKSMEERHKEETTRLERQYEVKFAGVVAQFSERINSMEKNQAERINSMERNLEDRMEMVIRMLEKRQA